MSLKDFSKNKSPYKVEGQFIPTSLSTPDLFTTSNALPGVGNSQKQLFRHCKKNAPTVSTFSMDEFT